MSYWDTVHKNLDKNLDDSHEIIDDLKSNLEIKQQTKKNNTTLYLNLKEEAQNVEYEYKDYGKQRKLENLFGYNVQRPREEWIEKEQLIEEIPETEIETWEKKRNDLKQYSERDRAIAYKRDELAEVDDEGYRYEPESPAFRDGYNNTLRIKPPVNPDLHNGFELNIQGKALETFFNRQNVKSKPSEKSLKPIEIQTNKPRTEHDIQVKINTPLLGIRKNKHDLKIKELFKCQSNIEIFLPNKTGIKKTLLKRDFYSKTLASLVLKAIFTENNFGLELTDEEKKSLKSKFKNGEIQLEELGKAFVELGFVMTPEIREESKRHEFDSKSLKLGQKILFNVIQGQSSEKPMIEESVKEDMALALGRTMNNLKSLLQIDNVVLKNEFTKEKSKKNAEILNLKSTFQLLQGLGTMKRKGSTSYFRNEKNIQDLNIGKFQNILLEGNIQNPTKSVWDALEKNIPTHNERNIYPARPDYL